MKLPFRPRIAALAAIASLLVPFFLASPAHAGEASLVIPDLKDQSITFMGMTG